MEKKSDNFRYLVGIDPGKVSGYCVVEVGVGIVELEGLDFWGCYDKVMGYGVEEVKVFIEISSSSHVWQGKGVGYRAFGKVGQAVGGVRREGELLRCGFERFGYRVESVEPQGKVGGEHFVRMTGWKGRTNQHCRDAGMLVWGRF